MKLLAIETSCDETSAAVLESKKPQNIPHILSHATASSIQIHAKTGGIIPENAAREQVKWIIPVITEALIQSEHKKNNYSSSESRAKSREKSRSHQNVKRAQGILRNSIDAIAVTYGPGLIGSLLVGVETAKTLAYVFNKPMIPVNHLLGHLYANFIQTESNPLSLRAKRGNLNSDKIASRIAPRNDNPSFPTIGLIVSGGHTDLLLFTSHERYQWLGGTRDDAAGEALDKIGRLLGLSYPAGPEIEKRAEAHKAEVLRNRRTSSIRFKSPMLHSENFDFSFSGLKTEVLRFVHKAKGFPQQHLRGGRMDSSDGGRIDEHTKNQICLAVQKAVIDVLVAKTLHAAQQHNAKSIVLGGGVAANQKLRYEFELAARRYTLDAKIFAPSKTLCTDNAAMIGAYAAFHPKPVSWKNLHANPELYFD